MSFMASSLCQSNKRGCLLTPEIALLNYRGIKKVIKPLPSPYPTHTYQSRPAGINVQCGTGRELECCGLGVLAGRRKLHVNSLGKTCSWDYFFWSDYIGMSLNYWTQEKFWALGAGCMPCPHDSILEESQKCTGSPVHLLAQGRSFVMGNREGSSCWHLGIRALAHGMGMEHILGFLQENSTGEQKWEMERRDPIATSVDIKAQLEILLCCFLPSLHPVLCLLGSSKTQVVQVGPKFLSVCPDTSGSCSQKPDWKTLCIFWPRAILLCYEVL